MLRRRLVRWQHARPKAVGFFEETAQKTAIVEAVFDIGTELGVPASHVAIAWLRQQGARAATAYVPIIGPRSAPSARRDGSPTAPRHRR
ncbi:aldo-keto reductase family protein [Actinacidiphila rubida]|uniref:hypothetical protein n=1 Tax=Actinacidiphila rubida TaxID=310780 RepID=UPI00114CA4BC|nr:hypothetical protein [Actinacidiphila rubida]